MGPLGQGWRAKRQSGCAALAHHEVAILKPLKLRPQTLKAPRTNPAGSLSAEGQLAQCDAVSGGERALWAGQDAVAEALPGALSEAFLRVERDFGAHCRVRAGAAPCGLVACRSCHWEAGSLLQGCVSGPGVLPVSCPDVMSVASLVGD